MALAPAKLYRTDMLVVPHDELPRRRPVWEARSDFFLDTELEDEALGKIAAFLRTSGYSAAQLEKILKAEVAPLLYGNLCLWVTVAGVWNGFDVDWIEQRILAGKHRWYQRWYGFANRCCCDGILRYVKKRYWSRVLPQLCAP
ncbi:MAG: hypothetical protein HZB38_03780 [Planctomycetes bacterium]|nr:hypothetical protein [Planctomycetota bacterium]